MKTIIVAVDFSDITSILINKAAEMAAYQQARVYIIHIAAPEPDFVGYKAGPSHELTSRVSQLKHEKKDLEKFAEQLRTLDIDTIPLLIQGATSKKIITETERLKAELLIMGTHGRGIALTALLGSTSHQVIEQISCPVLLIPYKLKQ